MYHRLFSDEGRSYAFDHRATGGFGRGEGVGCIVLKPLDEAIEANDSIRAVIVATGVNQDGRTKGITMPNGEAQAELMKSIYDSAGLDVNDTGFVEAHGSSRRPPHLNRKANLCARNRNQGGRSHRGESAARSFW